MSNDERTDFLTLAFSTMAYDYRFNFYLNDKIDILFSQLIQVMDVADSTVEGGDLIAGDLAFSELFLKP